MACALNGVFGQEDRLRQALVEAVVDFGIDDSLDVERAVGAEYFSRECRADECSVFGLSGDNGYQNALFVLVRQLLIASAEDAENGYNGRQSLLCFGVVRFAIASCREDSELMRTFGEDIADVLQNFDGGEQNQLFIVRCENARFDLTLLQVVRRKRKDIHRAATDERKRAERQKREQTSGK